jgi:S1-C subfamily serine protease
VTPSNKGDLGVSVEHGVLVIDVLPGSPAARAGLQGSQGAQGDEKGGDVIVSVAGQPVQKTEDIGQALDAHAPGDTIAVTVLRDGQQKALNVKLDAWPTS